MSNQGREKNQRPIPYMYDAVRVMKSGFAATEQTFQVNNCCAKEHRNNTTTGQH